MRYYVTIAGEYYEGEMLHFHDAEVRRRPSEYHVLRNGEWVEDAALKAEAGVAGAKSERIDEQSVRALRSIVLTMLAGNEPDMGDIEVLSRHEYAAICGRKK